MTGCDFIVIGGGIAGAGAAYELSRHGRVVLLERESSAGYHTTGRSAALFFESYGGKTIQRLTRCGRAFLQSPPDGFAEHPLLTPRGAVFVARADQLGVMEDALDHITTPGLTRLDPDETVAQVPALRRDYVAAGLLEPDAMDMDVNAIHQGFLRGARRRGAEVVLDAEVSAMTRRDGRWRVETRAGGFDAPVVVNAAGAWADVVARLAGANPIGLVPKRRTAFTFPAPAGIDTARWPLVIDIEEQFYFKPESGNFLGSPADETPSEPCDAQPEDLDIAIAIDRIERASTLQIRRVLTRWAGLRCFVADKTLVIGEEPGLPGFYWLAGQGGYGIQTSPAAARALTGLATEGALPADLAAAGILPEHLSPVRLRTDRSDAS
ncbi:MAG: FAD-binding oxidoreductase [Ectothiorhodospiraceae bacterium]|nr:FAD-binding oxidoreductase [Ectothiorhodospiraceae bacterium]